MRDGHLLLPLFNAFRFITWNLYINGKSVYCVVMCTAQFIDIQFFFLGSFIIWYDRSSIKIDIDVRDVHVKLYSITKKWWISYQIYSNVFETEHNLRRSIGCCHQLFSIIARYCDVLAFNLNLSFYNTIHALIFSLSLSHFLGRWLWYRAVYLLNIFEIIFKSNAIWK